MNVSKVEKLSLVGSQWGLSLLINVEQYENIKGLNTDAGIKVSLFTKGSTYLMVRQILKIYFQCTTLTFS